MRSKMNMRLRMLGLALVLGGLAQQSVAQGLPAVPSSPRPVTDYEYDPNGNLTKATQAKDVAGFGFATQNSYDTLDRLKNSTDARSGVTQLGYDGAGRTTQVTDPRLLVTQYPRNGLGDVTQLISPDTGTSTNTYDAAGNLLTSTDSRGVKATLLWDALNRLLSTRYTATGMTMELYSFVYDQNVAPYITKGSGRRTGQDYPAGNDRYGYDAQGRLIYAQWQVFAATGINDRVWRLITYVYDSAGNLTSITYPSGRIVQYGYSGGKLSSISLKANGSATPVPLLSQIQFEPFGAVSGWQWQLTSGTKAHQRVFDTSGRMVRYPLGGTVRDLTYDAADRIAAYTHYDAAGTPTPALDQAFGYDELGRLTSISANGSSWLIGYDANGNRTSVTLNGNAQVYTTSTTSNRLNSITNPARSFGYDAIGNTTSDSANYTATYGISGRLQGITKAGVTTSYAYSTLGHRVRKTQGTAATTTLYYFDPVTGQLMGEYDSTGAPKVEYVWLGGTPVAFFTPDPVNGSNPPVANYVQADHIDTPRVVTDRSGNVRWRWLAEPFGTAAPEENPSSIGSLTFNLRFPGQYFDKESGLHYNWNRDYDVSVGRYAQSDPIGLGGGNNTYAYVGGNPLSFTDVEGLAAAGAAIGSHIGSGLGGRFGPAGSAIGKAAGAAIGSAIEDSCQCPGGYLYIYRVVGQAEYSDINLSQRYAILGNGFGQKQFWLNVSDALWFVSAEERMQPSVRKSPRYIVYSNLCRDNMKYGFHFSDVGHAAISFGPDGLIHVNNDAAISGGIRTHLTVGPK